jgi:hypothetical protein
MNRRFSLDNLIAIVTVAFSVLSASALVFDFWHAPVAYVAAAQA